MTLYTKAQLVSDVLMTLRVTGAGETPSADDQSYISSLYDKKLAEWANRDLVYWENTGDNTAEIPGVVFTILRDLLVNQAASAYGKGPPSVLEIGASEELLLRGLRRHMARAASGFPTTAVYY